MTPDKLCEYLNQLLLIDRDALALLVESRVPCNSDLAHQPNIPIHMGADSLPQVGLLGILNGMLDNGRICAVYDDIDGKLQRFRPWNLQG